VEEGEAERMQRRAKTLIQHSMIQITRHSPPNAVGSIHATRDRVAGPRNGRLQPPPLPFDEGTGQLAPPTACVRKAGAVGVPMLMRGVLMFNDLCDVGTFMMLFRRLPRDDHLLHPTGSRRAHAPGVRVGGGAEGIRGSAAVR
jgi:hypothetical protein